MFFFPGAVPILLWAGPGVPELFGGQIAPEPFFWPLLKEMVQDPSTWIFEVSHSSVVSFAMPGLSAPPDSIFHPRDPFFAFSSALIRPNPSAQLYIDPEGWDGRSWYYRDTVRTAWPPGIWSAPPCPALHEPTLQRIPPKILSLFVTL